VDAEDTITLMVEWLNLKSGTKGTANYTSSWSAPKADVHSQQRFFYLGHSGEITVDQAHRGYTVATDEEGFKSVNPLFFRYVPNEQGKFAGQHCYGYKSFEAFVDAVLMIRAGKATAESFDVSLPTANATILMTAILEAGRLSLDHNGMPYDIKYHEHSQMPRGLEPAFK
jgi:D-galacturonate reductase